MLFFYKKIVEAFIAPTNIIEPNKKVITFSLHICTKEKGDVIIKKNRKVKKSESDSNNRKIIYYARIKKTEKVI